jgi:ParB family chromosome partitioning protein
LQLNKEVLELVSTGKGHLNVAHAKLLIGLSSDQQIGYANKVIQRGLTVSALRKEINQGMNRCGAGDAKPVTEPVAEKDTNTLALEEKLSELVGCPVVIDADQTGRGEVRVKFANYEILDGILEKIGYRYDD